MFFLDSLKVMTRSGLSLLGCSIFYYLNDLYSIHKLLPFSFASAKVKTFFELTKYFFNFFSKYFFNRLNSNKSSTLLNTPLW